jgi:hypothetical protein
MNLGKIYINIKIIIDIMNNKLQKISFYEQYPEYIPFIGNDFEKYRILLLGESHFFNNESETNKNPEDWYKNDNSKLNNKEKLRINTQFVVNNFTKTKSRRAVFGKIDSTLKECDYQNGIQSVAFMNAFQRPAIGNGKSIKTYDIDIEKSTEVINQVIEIIKPKYICFVSKKSYKKLSKKINFSNIDVVVHPASSWWHRKTKKGFNGKEVFSELLKKYKKL